MADFDPFAALDNKTKAAAAQAADPNFKPGDDPYSSPPVLPPDAGWAQTIGRKADDTVRAAANGATFGLADKIAGMFQGGQDYQADWSKQARDRSPYLSVGGEVAGGMMTGHGISGALEDAFPALARTTIPSLAANGAATSATMSGLDDVAHGQAPDPIKGLIQGSIGGVAGGAVGALGRVISPVARVRGAGANMTDADRAAATDVANRAAGQGIPLTVPEAVQGANPAVASGPRALYETSVSSPGGSQSAFDYQQSRIPLVQQAAARVGAQVADGADTSAYTASETAKDALQQARDLVRNSAQPDYDASERTIVGNMVAPRSNNGPATMMAHDAVTSDPIKAPALAGVQPNSILALDATKKQLGNMANADAVADPWRASLIGDEKASLAHAMAMRSPAYARANNTFGAGMEDFVNPLNAGPLGTIANTTNRGAQSAALFDGATPSEGAAAVDAAKRLAPFGQGTDAPTNPVGQGLFAHRIETQAADPRTALGIGQSLLPTQASRDVAQAVTPAPAMQSVNDLIDATRSINPTNRVPYAHDGAITPDGPIGDVWNKIRHMGRAETANLLQDPSNIPLLGVKGAAGNASQATAVSLLQDIMAHNFNQFDPRKNVKPAQ